ncbi:MAG TPA: hypothetical protein V6C81_25380 [Planktothrix sp.]|jgi:hypothetical protein
MKEVLNNSWMEFTEEFPEEEDCLQRIFLAAREAGVACKFCGSNSLRRSREARAANCNDCGQLVWFTAGTSFHRMRNCQARLFAIWCMENSIHFSSKAFAEVTGIAQSSALNTLQKLRAIVLSEMSEAGTQLASGCFEQLFSKRSRETPARKHPSAEQEEVDLDCRGACQDDPSTIWDNAVKTATTNRGIEDHPEHPSPQSNQDFNFLSDQEKGVFDLLEEKDVSSDLLLERSGLSVSELSASLTFLELADLIICLPGHRIRRKIQKLNINNVKLTDAVMSAVKQSQTCLKQIFHGISRKALQYYLAHYWCLRDRARWQSGRLLLQCMRTPPITDDDVLAYVSPAFVTFADAPN